MSESSKDEVLNNEDNKPSPDKENTEKPELTLEEKLKNTEQKLLRSLADSENQRRRFEKEIRDAFDFGGFNFAKEMLNSLDNLQRAKKSIQEDEVLKKSKEFRRIKYELIRKMDIGDGRIRYEGKIDDPHHDHMICVETGKIIEFVSDEIEMIQDKIAEEHGYEIIKHIHQLFVKPIKK